MSITVPAAGDPITAAWGISVADRLNRIIPITVDGGDFATTSTSPTAITGLSWTTVNGDDYDFDLQIRYTVGGVNTGLAISFDHDGGSFGYICTIYGNASATGTTTEWVSSTLTATGTTDTDSTSARLITVRGQYTCTADGTAGFYVHRRGTSTTVTLRSGSGGTVIST